MATDVDFVRIMSDADLQQFMLVACPDAVLVTSTDDRVVLYTGASEEIFGFAPVEVLNRKVSMVFQACDEVQRITRELEHCGTVTNGRLTAVRKDGTSFPAGVKATRMRDRFGTLLGTLLFVRDQSEMYAVERDLREREEKLDELGGLETAARHDGMTGLLRRSSAIAAAEGALKDTLNAGRPFSVAIFDIDLFRMVNETRGHVAGDRVLEVFAGVLRTTARANDILGRFSGGQLIAFLPGADLEAVSAFAERVRAAIELTPVMVGGDDDLHVTVSSGVASIPGCGGDLEAVLGKAGKRLLVAKEIGRNRVVANDGNGRNGA